MNEPIEKLLSDLEIARAIQEGDIDLRDPEEYLTRRRKDLIQPASMDLLLEKIDSINPMISESYQIAKGLKKPREIQRFDPSHHPDVSDDYVTFWPGYVSETILANIKYYNGKALFCGVELRSTLRRAGLDMGYMRHGIGFDEDYSGFIFIRNPQEYPISIQKGMKIAQLICFGKQFEQESLPFPRVKKQNPLGSGIPITDNKNLEKLIKKGYLELGGSRRYHRGVVLFHAGRRATYNSQQHIILNKDKPHQGISLEVKESDSHLIEPGRFIDIETIERIRLSRKVAMQVCYLPRVDYDSVSYFSTNESSGGWIDPGYGMNKPEGAVFSVQRKAFTHPFRVNKGDLIGYGKVFYFPDGVGEEYGASRGSHYSDGARFEAPKV